ncbi:MAG: 3-hydroxyacyl-ACP dehydratase FabZ family protein [Planctomycetota bacterium]|jgi:3-hydroxymyristoyl/3-hydroxydecanoyl-(acyl carrier protein) dehydratase
MKFDLVDQILEQDDSSIVTVKNVTAAEEYLGDHFPSFPILPGVMMLESMVQAARKLLQATSGPGPWVLAEVRNVRYGNMVRPGQQLRVAVEIKKTTDDEHLMQGIGTVDENTAVQGRFVLRPVRR